MFPKLRIFEISACVKGCCAFIGANVDLAFCPICDRPNDVKSKFNYLLFSFGR